ncbi:hypothetical protein BJ878DRAFT_185905 [Calycina marina]|uniref:Uncharacterized protein n=1 Tax=Calycina marina TaxID=1763456 RepID=A0A9P7Z8S8_9HELO|nr:hypothetical protein BJ878DRAFT_185905 [Calycina marina]
MSIICSKRCSLRINNAYIPSSRAALDQVDVCVSLRGWFLACASKPLVSSDSWLVFSNRSPAFHTRPGVFLHPFLRYFSAGVNKGDCWLPILATSNWKIEQYGCPRGDLNLTTAKRYASHKLAASYRADRCLEAGISERAFEKPGSYQVVYHQVLAQALRQYLLVRSQSTSILTQDALQPTGVGILYHLSKLSVGQSENHRDFLGH